MLPIFVYGTLMTGRRMAHLLPTPRRPARVRGTLYRLRAGYPALVPGGDAFVHGELADPPQPRLLDMLDLYEGVGEGLYVREEIDATIGLRQVRAWAWVMRPRGVRERGGVALPRGAWRSR